jgi:undecaprenyl phosphate N,N'-diacetylbacillosamine 1-phosphate transferase
MYKRLFKRLLDIIFSVLAILILSPLFVVIALFVRIKMGSPVLFSQERIGKDENIFRLYKFRSMTNEKDKNGNLLPEKDRLTKFGIALRSTSLDELPELFMILKGDMSFVGPRPQPKFYGPYYTKEERKAYTVRGGLIPPDSIGLEVQCSWEKQFEYEVFYAEHVSLWLDLKVIFCTFVILIKRMRQNYGADDRPMLHVYRADMEIPEDVRREWESKGVFVK